MKGLLVLAAVLAGNQAELGQAYRSPDPGALPLAGARAGASGLAPALRADDYEVRAAAVRAAAHAGDGWALLSPLAQVAAGGDRALAVHAARAAVRIAGALDRERVLDLDIPDDELAAALTRWRDLGADAGRWADVRVLALEIGRRLADALGADATTDDLAFDAAARVADDDPAVRRAALELLPPGALPRDAVAARVADDDPDVALAAAQALCAELAVGAAPAPALAALGPGGLQRVRALVADEQTSAVARADARRCLAAAK